jgi:L-lactate dehydrogenase complex protein LldG
VAGSGPSSARLPELTTAFEAQLARIGASLHRVSTGQAGGRVVEILRESGCETVAVAQAVPGREVLLKGLHEAGLAAVPIESLAPVRRADAGVSVGRLGVAETGSVLLHSSSADRRVELCVDIHLVLLLSEGLVATLDEAFGVVREISGRGPAYVSLVSGPSRSADIERMLTIGVHGPRALHIVLLERGA